MPKWQISVLWCSKQLKRDTNDSNKRYFYCRAELTVSWIVEWLHVTCKNFNNDELTLKKRVNAREILILLFLPYLFFHHTELWTCFRYIIIK